MKIRWTKRAIGDLVSIHAHISKDSPAAASRVAAAVLDAAAQIGKFPQGGRKGRTEGTREIVISGLPYIVPYRIANDTILLLAVAHTSRKWPKKL